MQNDMQLIYSQRPYIVICDLKITTVYKIIRLQISFNNVLVSIISSIIIFIVINLSVWNVSTPVNSYYLIIAHTKLSGIPFVIALT